MSKHLVLVGGGHAHMMTLENIDLFVEKGYRVTVIGPSPYHYYSGMGPGMLGGSYQPGDIRFATATLVHHKGGTFVKDKVIKVDPEKKIVSTMSGKTFSYDVVSFNAGSYVPMGKDLRGLDNVYSVKPIERLMEAGDKLKKLFGKQKIAISIVGGGPSSAEVAGNVHQLAQKSNGHMPHIRIFAGRKFMRRFPENVRSRVITSLVKKGVEIVETGYVKKVAQFALELESGEKFTSDFTFIASGVKPSTIFEDSGLPVGPDKGLLVNKYLQSVSHPEIFGGGDCICFKDDPLDKVGVYAVRQNPVLLHNLMAALGGTTFKEFDPGPEYLLIFNLGGGTGLLKKKKVVFTGKIAFFIKDYIDRKFMREFQAAEKML